MAVRKGDYAKWLDYSTKRGKSASTAHRIASKLADPSHPLGKKDKYDKPSMLDKAILKRLRRRKKRKK